MNFLNVRYRYDNLEEHGLADGEIPIAPDSRAARTKLLAEAVQITPALFPSLAQHLSDLKVAMRLEEKVDCFVVPQPTIQAFCLPHARRGKQGYSVVLSSALVERLEPDEIRFVIGHEVGHFICEHWKYPSHEEDNGLGHRLVALQLSRAAEISADRIGMLASNSLDSACAAMIKVAAGLGAPYLCPDVPSILHQFRQLAQEEGMSDAIWMTHPIIPLRVRALLRFDPIFRAIQRGEEGWGKELEKVDQAIEADFHRSTGQVLHRMSDDQLETVRCWGLVYLFCADGVISKVEQRILGETLGCDRAAKVLKFLRLQKEGPKIAVESKLTESVAEAVQVPLSRRQELVEEFERLVEEAGIGDATINTAMENLRCILHGQLQ